MIRLKQLLSWLGSKVRPLHGAIEVMEFKDDDALRARQQANDELALAVRDHRLVTSAAKVRADEDLRLLRRGRS